MNNEELRAMLQDQKAALDDAVNDLTEYETQVGKGNWPNTVKSRNMSAIKASASKGGVDATNWNGKAAVDR